MRIPRYLLLCLPAAALAEPAISFKSEVAPLLNRRCAACHNEETAKGRYRLDSYARLLKPGESGEKPIVPGKPEESEFFRLLLEPNPHDRMPQKADPLPAPELALLRRWIEQGAPFDGGRPERPLVEMARESFLRPAPEHYPRPFPISALAFSPDGKLLAVSGYFEVTLWRVADGTLARRIGGLPERITALAWSPQTGQLAIAGGTPFQWGTVALADPATGAVRLLCDLPESSLAVAFSPDGRILAAGSGDRTVRLFDTATGKQTKLLKHHADWVQSVGFSPDGARLVTASRDRTVRVLAVSTGEIEATYNGHETALLEAAFTPRGDEVYSLAAHERALHRWKIETPTKANLVATEHELLQFAQARVGVIVTCPYGPVEVLQGADKQVLFRLFGHRDTVQAIALTPKGDGVATGSYDGEVLIWDFACGAWTQKFLVRP